MATNYTSEVQKLYIAYFNRPADPAGLNYWVAQLEGGFQTIQQAENGFSSSAEYQAIYVGASTAQLVNTLYLNLFGRPAETAGLLYWVGRINSGVDTITTVADAIASNASANDLIALTNKIQAATAFTANVAADATEIINYSGAESYASASAWLATVTTTDPTVAEVDAAVEAATSTAVIGENVTLTPDMDTVEVTTANTVDTVKGYWEGTASDTFSVADAIDGNGLTNLRMVVAAAGTAPYVEMSGIDKLSVVAAGAYSFDMNAGTYGTDISTISLSGADLFDLDVMNLSVEGDLELSVAASTDGDIYASGTADGVGISATLYNDDADGVGAVASIGSAGLSATLGENDSADLYYYQTASKSAAAVSVGNLTVAGVDLVLGKSASASLTISNTAHNTGAGSATVGNVTIGDINVAAGLAASLSMTVYNSATANNGAAKVGSITVGDIAWTASGSSATGEIEFYNNAQSTKGNATAGDITIGNITVANGSSPSSVSVSASNSANAITSGNAKVGNITVGDLTYMAGDDFSSPDFSFENNAYADKGTATAGNITFGNVSLVGGNLGGEIELTLANYAAVTTSGAATVGSVTVGDINMVVGTSSSAEVSISNAAYTAKGAATVGAVTVGNVTGTAGLNGSLDVWVSAQANGTAGDSVGAVTIGNVALYGEPNANLSFEVSISADTGSVANVSIGNIDMTVDNSGSLSFDLDIDAQKNVGDVVIGDVTLTLGSSASIDTFSAWVSASTGDIASFTIGDVTIVGGANAYDGSQGFTISAGDDLGAVTIGDVSVQGGAGAQFNTMTWDFNANAGNIGAISMGDTELTIGAGGNNYRYVTFSADGEIASVSVGDVTLSAAKSGSAWLSHNYSASDDIGNIVYGNVSNMAVGAAADAGFSIEADANGNIIGTVTVGDVDLHAKGNDAWAGFSLWLSDTGDTVGLVTVGDINLLVENVAAGITNAANSVWVNSNGSVTVGDISVTAGAATLAYLDTANVNALVDLESGNNLVVGDVTVVGGYSNSTPTLLDNFSTMSSWLMLSETGSGAITIGDVDYSGYKAAAFIDVSGYKGAGVIMAAQKATDITLNTTKNVVTLGAGNDIVDVKTGGTLKATADVIDIINGFTSGSDVIQIDTSLGQNNFDFVSSPSATYAAFLTSAGDAMANFGTDFYARQVGADLYLAVDKDNGGAVDFVIKLTGISTIIAADIASY